ncbi:MAG TPA: pilus assembly protein TadG-related protein [Bryobacteraceae bacterium]|nr:pilus assembly protein TadG-related protein [Bryobacteraceae bacterium]
MPANRTERGSVLVMFTLSLFLMVGVLGLVVDIGWCYYRKQVAQSAADAAVLAAAAASTSAPDVFTCGTNGIACQDPTSCGTSIPNPPTTNLQVGCLYAQTNGFSAGSGQTVLISANTTSPSPGAPGVQVPYWITVSINEQEAQSFSAIFGQAFLNVGAHATASVFPAPGDCVYALAGSGVGLSVNGNVAVQTKCGIYVDSNSSSALTASGSNSTITVTGADIYVVGGVSTQNSTQVSPTPTTGASVASDPLQFMPAPTVGACTSAGVNLTGHSTQTISQGVYCGSISVGGNASLIMNPGTYILKNGFSVAGGGTVTGSGVTLYNLSGTIAVSGGANMTLSAPISGTYQGVTIFQDRSNTSTVKIDGGATQFINGVIYTPAAELDYTGGSGTTSLSTLLVGNTVVFVGNSYITATPTTGYSGGAGGPTLIQ